MAKAYVFRGIDSDLWRQARGECTKRGVKLLELVEKFLGEWLRTPREDKPMMTTSAPADPAKEPRHE